MSQRLLILTNSFQAAGSERNVAVYCKHMDKNRVEPQVWTLYHDDYWLPMVHEAQIPVSCLDRRRPYGPLFACRAAHKIAHAQVDVVHAFHPAIGFYAALAKSWLGMKTPLVFSEATSTVQGHLHRLFHRYVIKNSDALAANSNASAGLLGEFGAHPDSLRLIRNGHEPEIYQNLQDRNEVRARLCVAPGQPLAIFVGRLIESKRVVDLLSALPRVHEKHPSLRTVIVGHGRALPAARAQAAQLGLESHVTFLGRRRDVPELLQASDLFVFPSEIDGLPNSIVEAALAGLPIVGCQIDGVRDVVGGVGECQLVPTRDPCALAHAICQVLNDMPAAQARAAEVRRKAIDRYHVKRSLDQLYELYDSVCT